MPTRATAPCTHMRAHTQICTRVQMKGVRVAAPSLNADRPCQCRLATRSLKLTCGAYEQTRLMHVMYRGTSHILAYTWLLRPGKRRGNEYGCNTTNDDTVCQCRTWPSTIYPNFANRGTGYCDVDAKLDTKTAPTSLVNRKNISQSACADLCAQEDACRAFDYDVHLVVPASVSTWVSLKGPPPNTCELKFGTFADAFASLKGINEHSPGFHLNFQNHRCRDTWFENPAMTAVHSPGGNQNWLFRDDFESSPVASEPAGWVTRQALSDEAQIPSMTVKLDTSPYAILRDI